MVTRNGLLLTIVLCAAALGIVEIGLRVAADPGAIPTSYEAPRNPHFRRDWAQWTRVPATLPGERRVVVISNSQGFLRERAEGEWAYPARLAGELSRRTQSDVRTLNWSAPGGKIPEMVVLAARAARHDPSDIVLVTYTENFVGDSMRQRLSFGITDIPLLTADPAVRGLLSDDFKSRYQIGSVAAWTGLNTGFGLARWRTIEGMNETWDWEISEPRVDLSTLAKTVEPWDDLSEGAAREFVETARRAAPQARLWILTMPLPRPAWTPEAWAEMQRLVPNIRAAVGDAPLVTVASALEVVPAEHFYTHTHFDPDGHAIFAAWLADLLTAPRSPGEAG